MTQVGKHVLTRADDHEVLLFRLHVGELALRVGQACFERRSDRQEWRRYPRHNVAASGDGNGGGDFLPRLGINNTLLNVTGAGERTWVWEGEESNRLQKARRQTMNKSRSRVKH